ncbi:sensor histidine kinase [Terrisporobacter mayombei]|uniref:histidine kinase n=1 Tax=Terrisporobacter mayombei TaxID=1541 RepID=A0ABY9PXA0_9FIRM|nr:HAMP domain-containing sensor histidine kinase [Terrisporobacter mayombei]MCC3868158.1 HAMP domain-containing histidine kinase [Terrisporobacter mayombei]WMT80298.1 Adaptive-response sensory-kinase SasA [Terrisporobacter mayombei]
MNKLILIIGIVAVAVLVIVIPIILLYRRRIKKIMNSLFYMLDSAIDGSFTADTFDESALSAVEEKMFRFLSSCAVSSKNLTMEKENIKRLISDISHQTKTPVANIMLYSQILMEHDLPEDSIVCAKALATQAEKLDFLMLALVKVSRLESGIITVNPQKGTMQALLNSVIAQIRPKAEEKEIIIETELTNGTVYYDSKWTVEAIYNVLDNAVKYSHRQSTVTIRSVPYNLFFRIDVIDQGIGIAEDEQGKIFSRFYRSSNVSGREGIGLGLFLTREILSEGGGYIKVSRALELGSIFSIFLPTEKR